jgi:hypothetical protein
MKSVMNSVAKMAIDKLAVEDEISQQEILSMSYDQIMRMVAESGTNIQLNKEDPYGDGDQSPLKGKRADRLRTVWAAGGDFYRCAESNQLSEFGMACFVGHIAIVQRLLATVTGVEKERLIERRETICRKTPLLMCIVGMRSCCHKGHWKEVIEILIKNGARVNAKDIGGYTATFYVSGAASTEATLEMLPVLVKAGGDVNTANRFGAISLHETVMSSKLDALRALLTHGASLQHADSDGVTPLALASSYPAAMQVISEHSRSGSARMAWKACLVCAISRESGMLRCSRYILPTFLLLQHGSDPFHRAPHARTQPSSP